MKKSLLLVMSLTLSLFAIAQTPPPVHHTVYQDCSKMGHRYDYTKGQTQDSIDYGNAPANVEAVDLGLPSGIRWANMNVGATTPKAMATTTLGARPPRRLPTTQVLTNTARVHILP